MPTGIATDDNTKEYFQTLVEGRELASFFSFENEEFIFPAVHHAFKFALLTLERSGRSERVDLIFFARQVSALADQTRHFSLTPADFAVLIWGDAAEKDTAISDAELQRKITGGMILVNACFPQLHRAPVAAGAFRFRGHASSPKRLRALAHALVGSFVVAEPLDQVANVTDSPTRSACANLHALRITTVFYAKPPRCSGNGD